MTIKHSLLAATLALSGLAMAQDNYPSKAITLTVPNPPGNVAYGAVARAKPDGYNLLISYSAYHVGNPALTPSLPWEAKDFAPVALLTVATNVIAAHPSVPANNLKEFIAYLKANPGKVNYASQGNGSLSHIGTEIFKQQSGTFMTHIPYRGSGPAVADVLAGQVQVFITTPPSVMQHVVSGKLKAFAVTGTKRHPGLPNVPTVAEAGMPDFKLEAWVGLFAPAATPPAVVAKLTADVKKALDMPETRQRADAAGIELRYLPPDALGELVKTETAYWAKTIKAAGIKAD